MTPTEPTEQAQRFAQRVLAMPEWQDPANHARMFAEALDAAHNAAATAAAELPRNGLTFLEHQRVAVAKAVPDDYTAVPLDMQILKLDQGAVRLANGKNQQSVILTGILVIPAEWLAARTSVVDMFGKPKNPLEGMVPLACSRLVIPTKCLSALGLASVVGPMSSPAEG